jgi:thiol:disulfide interchange protein
MSRSKEASAVVVVLATAWLWKESVSLNGGFARVFSYAAAGILSGLGLIWIFRTFASLDHSRRSLIVSALWGLVMVTPALGLLMHEGDAEPDSTRLVLAFAAAGGFAMAGAIYGVATLAHDAFAEWREDRSSQKHQLITGGTHR